MEYVFRGQDHNGFGLLALGVGEVGGAEGATGELEF
jgi:hypothetical protein